MERFLDFQFRKEVKLWPLFLNQSFRAVAVSLLSLFSSIYIYKTLLSLTNQESIALLSVFIFFLGLYGFKLISTLFAEELSLKLGLKKQIYFGLLFLALCLFILALSLKQPLWLFWASVFWGLATGFYWFGRHGLMAKMGRVGAFGKELGMIGACNTLLLLAVPFLGGVLINFAGYKALFGSCLFFVFLSFLSLKPVREKKTHYDTNLTEILNLFRTHKRTFLAYLGDSAGRTIYGVVIPLYIFLILKKELSLGEFFSLSMILVALINLVTGRWVDIKGKRKVIGFGAVISFLVWFGRLLSRNVSVLFVFDVLDRITAGMTGIPLSVLSYEKALDGHSTGRAVLFREMAMTCGSIIACLLLITMALLGIELKFSFLVAGVFSLLPLLIVRS